MHILYCFCCGTNVYCLPIKYGNLICYKVLLYQVSCVSVFRLVSYTYIHQCAYSHCSLLWCEKGIVFTNKLSEYWCHIIKPYLFIKFHASKHSGMRVTQTCMPYLYGPKLFFCGFPKSKVFTQTLICLFPVRHQTLYLYQVSYVGVLQLVRFAKSTRRRRRRRTFNR